MRSTPPFTPPRSPAACSRSNWRATGWAIKADLHTVQAGETVEIGPFKVEFFHVCHSIPDGVGLGIYTPAGLIVHSGDYKFDHTPVDGKPSDYARLADFLSTACWPCWPISTNAERPGWTLRRKVVDAGAGAGVQRSCRADHHRQFCLADLPHAAGG